jgi:hypothetical protein
MKHYWREDGRPVISAEHVKDRVSQILGKPVKVTTTGKMLICVTEDGQVLFEGVNALVFTQAFHLLIGATNEKKHRFEEQTNDRAYSYVVW